MLDVKVSRVFTSYSLDQRKTFSKLTSDNPTFQSLVKQTMASVTSSSKLREMVVAKKLGMIHNQEVNGSDAIDLSGRHWEIKTEQRTKERLRGESKFHYSNPENLKLYQGRRVLQGGFVNGKLVFIVSFSFKEAGLYAKLIKIHQMNKDKNGHTMSVSHWSKLRSLRLHYIRKEFVNTEYMTLPLVTILKKLHVRGRYYGSR